ncbi:hypothetical protein BAUCODRAFT_110250 [Baudoinia panamericana UAMH 10762]|uniref:Calcineurin-like phosphoesterase domain-containing protein n=1 Tax=Baudoinia panamericana (strain UAMH 10762) TaxID=717646 RepID=M2N8B4_BAUPA|nr:uncharacterized protein BAUCODRAFT_110250 [Baudoinia panamericana UAMH 10762]EMC95045.1 hypothetical protein BAUCODRAFT_110250 [Baudoinia panamericana UAMH 10762]
MTATVKTRLLIISDTHCAALRADDGSEKHPRPPFEAPLPSADVLIHCGDMTMTGEMDEYHQTLDMIREIDAPVKLVIAGNHDLSLDRDYIFNHLAKEGLIEEHAAFKVKQARDLWTASNGRAKTEGITFLDEGVHNIDLPNGAHLVAFASPYTPEFWDWAFPTERDEDRWNTPLASLSDAKNIAPYPVPGAAAAQSPIDVLITHGPSWDMLDRTVSGDLAGCPHLLRAVMRARPLVHCFGHIHEGWGAKVVSWAEDADEVISKDCLTEEWKHVRVDPNQVREQRAAYLDGTKLRKGRQTALINAAIMDVTYQPVNAPWLVDIELPRTESG